MKTTQANINKLNNERLKQRGIETDIDKAKRKIQEAKKRILK